MGEVTSTGPGEFDFTGALPEGVVVTHSLHMVAYLDKDGENGYLMHTSGTAPYSNYIAMAAMAEFDLNLARIGARREE